MSEQETAGESGQHQAAHGQVNPCLLCLREPLVILAQPTIPAEPGAGLLDDLAPRQDLEAGEVRWWLLVRWPAHPAAPALDDGHVHALGVLHPLHDRAPIPDIDSQVTSGWEAFGDASQHLIGPVMISRISEMHHGLQPQSARIDQPMALAPVQFRGPALATRPTGQGRRGPRRRSLG